MYKFNRRERLGLDRDVESVLREGRRVSDETLSLAWLGRAGTLRRIALRVPKRLGNAVDRNRVKRVLREIFRKEKSRIRPGTDMVLIVRPFPQLAGMSFGELRDKSVSLFKKAGIWEGAEERS